MPTEPADHAAELPGQPDASAGGTPHSDVRLTDPRALRGYAHPTRLALVGLLRTEGSLTATQAAARLGESVPSCSFHLRQLAKYGLVEPAGGGRGRERPWRATATFTSWDNVDDDPAVQAAIDELDASVVDLYTTRARQWLTRRDGEPVEWRAASDFSDYLLYLTADELRTLTGRMQDLLGEYLPRTTDPQSRPPGARRVSVVQIAFPAEWQPPTGPHQQDGARHVGD